jgi:hypothetical protein
MTTVHFGINDAKHNAHSRCDRTAATAVGWVSQHAAASEKAAGDATARLRWSGLANMPGLCV